MRLILIEWHIILIQLIEFGIEQRQLQPVEEQVHREIELNVAHMYMNKDANRYAERFDAAIV